LSGTLCSLFSKTLLLFLLSFFSTAAAGYAESIFLYEGEIETHGVGDGEYVTTGTVLMAAEASRFRDAMSNASNFSQWLLKGMGNEAAIEHRLKVALTGIHIDPNDPPSCRLDYSLFLTKRWVLEDKHLKVSVTASPEQTGWVNKVSFKIPFDSSSLVRGGEYHVYILPVGPQKTLVFYHFKISLAGLAQLFFSERMYSRNIKWYIRKIMMNCVEYLDE
jgi:hypothetical protein